MKSTADMKVRIEIKVALIGIATILVLIWGINYLKGRNILGNNYELITFYQETGGLETSAPVLMKGVKIGYVDRVELRTDESPPIKVVLSIEKSHPVQRGTSAELFSADLLGTRAIRITGTGSGVRYAHRDTIPPKVAAGMLNRLEEQLLPMLDQVASLAASLESLSRQLDSLVAGGALQDALSSLTGITRELEQALRPGGALAESFENLDEFTGMLSEQKDEVAGLLSNMNAVSASLDSAGLDSLALELRAVAKQLNLLTGKMNTGTGTAGRLIHSDSLYNNLNKLVTDLDHLVRDLSENPEDYVQISVFGKKDRGD